MYLLNKIAAFIWGGKLLADDVGSAEDIQEKFSWVGPLYKAMKNILTPILAVVAAAGTIYAVVIAVQMARADSGERREEAKKRLISVIVAVVVLVVLILFFTVFFPMIMASAGIPLDAYTA